MIDYWRSFIMVYDMRRKNFIGFFIVKKGKECICDNLVYSCWYMFE